MFCANLRVEILYNPSPRLADCPDSSMRFSSAQETAVTDLVRDRHLSDPKRCGSYTGCGDS